MHELWMRVSCYRGGVVLAAQVMELRKMDETIASDLRELKRQLSTVLDDAVVLSVFDRAVNEIVRLRTSSASGPGGYASGLCQVHKVPLIHTITDDTLCAVCERAARAAGGGW